MVRHPHERRRISSLLALGVAAVLAGAIRLPAQADRPSFEVVSIRSNKSGEVRVSGGFLPGGRYRVVNYPLRDLIAAAYLQPQINPDFLISGGPQWIDRERFDIDARAESDFPAGPDGPTAPRRQMLQELLADRFGLRVHRETSQRPVYALTMARTGGTFGPRLRPAAVACAESTAATASSGSAAPACGARIGPGFVTLVGTPLRSLTSVLPRFVNRVVVDHTGLMGPFDLDLTWTPAPGEWVAPPVAGGTALPVSDGPSLFSALQEQLGLKLEPARAPVDVLVIDHAEMPVDN